MSLIIRSPKIRQQRGRFRPGLLLWIFTLTFLPLFMGLSFWQLNRANEKEQMLALTEGRVLLPEEVNWAEPPLYREVNVRGTFSSLHFFLLDNRTHNGQFGYEVWRLISIPQGRIMLSLGWVAGSADRKILPDLGFDAPDINGRIVIRPAPENALFDVGANIKHPDYNNFWVVQSLSIDWIETVTKESILAFAQLIPSDEQGVGPNIWQPSVMTPLKHRGYALQWFAMAIALLGMFIYAGLKPSNPS